MKQKYCSIHCANKSPEHFISSKKGAIEQWKNQITRDRTMEGYKKRSVDPKWSSLARRRGVDHPNYKGNRKAQEGRDRTEYQNWRKQVYIRDDYTCQTCGERGRILNAHHIKPWAKFPDLRYDVSNGITLCEKCHDLAHNRIHTPKTYACIDCGKKKGASTKPRCRSCAAKAWPRKKG